MLIADRLGNLQVSQDPDKFPVEFPTGMKPSVSVQLSERDRQLLAILTRKIRVLTIEQIARTWFHNSDNPKAAAKRRVKRMSEAGWLATKTMLAHPEILLEEPVFKWLPGNESPGFGQIAYRLKARWNQSPVSTSFVLATSQAGRTFGGYVADRAPRQSEASHDLHLAQVYLLYRVDRPASAKRWVSEHQLYAEGGGRGERLPDAILRHPSRNRSKDYIIEFGGAYSKSKLSEFHAALSHLRYEIW